MTKFIEISNKDIYDKIKLLIESNDKAHNEIIKHQLETNGKVKLNKWISTTAISLALITIGFGINYLIRL